LRAPIQQLAPKDPALQRDASSTRDMVLRAFRDGACEVAPELDDHLQTRTDEHRIARAQWSRRRSSCRHPLFAGGLRAPGVGSGSYNCLPNREFFDSAFF
jgi:hypothetical protein